jgi:hypothetical protein
LAVDGIAGRLARVARVEKFVIVCGTEPGMPGPYKL